MSQNTGTYVPPSLDDVGTEPAPATESSKAPLLSREERSDAPASGAPAAPSPSAGGAPQAALQSSGHVMGIPAVQLPEVPDAMRLWKQQKQYMHLWLGLSVFTILFFSPIFVAVGFFFPALVASILGTLASSMYLCSCWSTDMASQVRTTVVMGSFASILDACNAMLGFMIITTVDCGDRQCRAVVVYMVFFSLCLGVHAWVSYQLMRQAREVTRLLNPVSSGLVAVNAV